MGTIDGQGRPHLVPVTFTVVEDEIVSAIDHKPKRTTRLARLRHIEQRPVATALFDRYADDWSHLGWVMARGIARVESPGYRAAQLAARYEQYRDSPPAGRVIVLSPRSVVWWLGGKDVGQKPGHPA